MTTDIAFTREGHIGFITLRRAQALNALTLPMIKALQQQLLLWQDEPTIHAVVIQAEAGKAFCAGGDVRWLYETGLAHDPKQMQFFWHEYRLNHYIHHFPKPYISLMDGITMGGGVGISLHGSHSVATERFTFAMPETGIGFFPDIGASYLLSRCPGKTGIYLGLTGNRLNAQEAGALGLINHVISSTQIATFLQTLLDTDLSVDAHQRVTACLQPFTITPENLVIDTINSCFIGDCVESIINTLQQRGDEWATSILHTLAQKSPLSLKVTLAQIQKAEFLSLAECIQLDYCLAAHFMRDTDFYEGIRALLIDKDKSPQWQPAHLALVSKTQVAEYFECSSTLPLLPGLSRLNL